MGHAQVLPFHAKLAVGVQKRQEACREGRYPALRLDAYDVFHGNFQQGDVGHAPLGNESVQAEMNKVRDDLKLDYVFPWEK